MIAMPCIVDGSRILFSYSRSYHAFISCSISLTASRLSTTWSRKSGSQITNTQTLP